MKWKEKSLEIKLKIDSRKQCFKHLDDHLDENDLKMKIPMKRLNDISKIWTFMFSNASLWGL